MKAMNGLTHTEIVGLKRQLDKEQTRIRDAMHEEFVKRNVVNRELSNATEVIQYSETTDDDAVVNVLNDARISTMTRASTQLGLVEAGLTAITLGKYGVCEDCARHIGFKRLSVNPTAVCCMPCQTRREKNIPHASL